MIDKNDENNEMDIIKLFKPIEKCWVIPKKFYFF